MPIQLTDAEQAFADSARGRHHVAYARSKHDLQEAHKGTNARPFTDAMAAEAARVGAAEMARTSVYVAALAAQRPAAEAARDTALAMRKVEMSNAYKGGRS